MASHRLACGGQFECAHYTERLFIKVEVCWKHVAIEVFSYAWAQHDMILMFRERATLSKQRQNTLHGATESLKGGVDH
jgi:hypothetical protein